jgi:hypothetical protein
MGLMSDLPLIRIQAAKEFQDQLRVLAKRYRQIRDDIQPLITQLQQGETPGEQVAGTGYTVRAIVSFTKSFPQVRFYCY